MAPHTIMPRRAAVPMRRAWLCLMVAVLLLSGIVGASAAPARQASTYPGLDDPDPKVRAETVQAIRKAQDRKAVSTLIAHIEDPDQQVGLYIAQALVELSTREELTPLLVTVSRANADGRWRAAYVLGERQDSRGIPSLSRALRDEEVLVTRTAADALASIGSRAAIEALLRSLQSQRPAEIHAAMRGLLLLGDAAVPVLDQALESGDPEVEKSIAIVLEAIGTPASRAALG